MDFTFPQSSAFRGRQLSIPVPKTRTAFYGPSPPNSPLRESPPPPSSLPHDIWLRQRARRPAGPQIPSKRPPMFRVYREREGHCHGALESALISESRDVFYLQELHFLHLTRESLVGKATRRKMPFLLLLPSFLMSCFPPLHKSRQNCFPSLPHSAGNKPTPPPPPLLPWQ